MDYSNTQKLNKRKANIQKRIFFIAICLLLTVVALVIISRSTVGALQTVQQHQMMVHRGDVQIIRQWMTVPYISHQFRVPNHVLFAALRLKDTPANHHSTLQTIAIKQKVPVNIIINKLQKAILAYRKTHPFPRKSGLAVYRGENGGY